MITLLEIIKRSADYLAERGIENARREAEEVIADAMRAKRLDLYLQHDRPLTDKELPDLRQAIQRRSKREPTAYISGSVSFADLTIHVTPDVLIPRPETEILVEKISQTLSNSSTKEKVLWDMCCGCGCIGLALKHRFPQLKVILSDLSGEALSIARTNASVDVEFKQGDLFAPFAGLKCDYFICNPPYVTEEEYTHLSPEVRDWEPKMALVAGKSGLEFYQHLAKELPHYLNPNGLGWLELGAGQGSSVKSLFESAGYICHYDQDWSGHDRFFYLHGRQEDTVHNL